MQMGLVTVNKDCDFISNLRIDDFADVFDGGLGELPGTQHLQLKPDTIPVVMANRKTPLDVRPRLKTELERLVNLGVLTEVNEPTPWISQIVITEKKNGSLRLCLDPHKLNKNLREHYTLNILEDVLHEMRNAKVLSKVDLSSSYWHVKLDEESSKLTRFQTCFGRFHFLRLPFRVNG